LSLKLDQLHDTYKANRNQWQKLLAAVSGKNVDQLIKRLSGESDDDLRIRRDLAEYFNAPQLALDLWLAHLLKKQPTRELPDILAPRVDDIDRQGTTAGAFMRQVAEIALIYGVCSYRLTRRRFPRALSR
jgi:hypothetical protein